MAWWVPRVARRISRMEGKVVARPVLGQSVVGFSIWLAVLVAGIPVVGVWVQSLVVRALR